MTRRRLFVALAILVLAFALGAAALIVRYGGDRESAIATIEIGGPFTMTDQNGNTVTEQDLLGHPSLVFFGFTFCPDVCPTTLSDISGWLDALGEDAGQMNVVFITVDPDRDTVEAMAEYVGYFHPAIRGWTGAQDQIARAAEGFRASYERVPTDGGDYTMNHTASVFLFDAAGGFVSMIDYHEPREFAVPKIRRALEEETEGAT